MLGDYRNSSLALAEDLINTFDLYLEQPEHLREPADLRHFVETREIQFGDFTQSDLDQVRGLRSYLRAVWEAETTDEALRMLNVLFANISIYVQLEVDAGGKPRFLFQVPPDESIAQRLSVEAATGIVTAIQQVGVERLRSCAAEPCRKVFIDGSRNHSRRFCSDRCSNRYNTAAFRERQRRSDGG
ncbi:hypothetical protein PLCT1_01441 [Planctomycetaceae bacterium]|nr:hypothetical protein PLCT1_01441 [Planctomycetaceae bacterium]